MKLIAGILYFDTSDMKAIGVSINTLRSAKSRGSKSYVIIDDPDDRRRLLVEYDSLKPQLKERTQEWLGECPYSYHQKAWITSYVQPDAKAYRYLKTYRIDDKGLGDEDIERYYIAIKWLNMIIQIADNKALLKTQGISKAQFWNTVCTLIQTNNIRLPYSYQRLLKRVKEYKDQSYNAVIKTGNYGTQNGTIITDEIAEWLVAQYALPIKHKCPYMLVLYKKEAEKRGWPEITDSNTIYRFLHRKDIKQHWYGPRHGWNNAKEIYAYTLRTKLPTVRDALWYSDGTKLNFYDREGKLKASWTAYEVIDVYSEVLLGYHIAKSENHVTQYHAYKMALQTSMQKPFEIRTDNQGGHKKIKAFMDKLSHINIRTRPYNGKSKTIENIFGRFQQGVMRKLWFYTGQNITAKSMDSKVNMEFILENTKHLPTQEQMFHIYAECREEWNNGKHHKYKRPRLELYKESNNPKAEPIDYLDMVDLFWLQAKKPITYYTTGITIEINKTKYEYEVLKEGMPDDEFRRKYIGDKFIVKYDIENMEHVRLYKTSPSGLQFIDIAEPRLVVPRAIQDYQDGDRERIFALIDYSKSEVKSLKQSHKQREEQTNVSAKELIKEVTSLAEYQKRLSYQGEKEKEQDDLDDWMDIDDIPYNDKMIFKQI